MLLSKYLLPTLKEVPADAEVVSHKLMLRAGMIRKLAAGIYSTLPAFQRSLQKLKMIIREEMNRAGALELTLPGVQPAELWQESRRWDVYGKELLRLKDRHDRDFCLGPTHEEVITDLVRREIRSYRQLPVNLYQIQTKFRDEIRPRFGIMRAREFIMKDAYSFDADEAGAEASYHAMYDAYGRIFERCGLEFRAVEADTGSIGGSFSHEFMVLADSGEDNVVYCESCGYAANQEKAEIKAFETDGRPADHKPREEVETPGTKTVEELTAFLDISADKVIKTIIFDTESGAVAALVRGDHEINEIKLRNYLGCNELKLADDALVEKTSRAPRGFAGPVDLELKIYADNALKACTNMVAGANAQDLHFKNVNLGRDFSVTEYADLRQAYAGDICARCGGTLNVRKGIEVGHIFKLGTKYSEALSATYLDKNGKEQLIVMGCYGIGVGRTVAAAIEQNHDKDGIIFPKSLSPFHVYLLPISMKDTAVRETALKLYDDFAGAGIDALLDDRDERPGIKFKDADLIGIPLRITIGKKTLAEGNVEVRNRQSGETGLVRIEQIVVYVQDFYGRQH